MVPLWKIMFRRVRSVLSNVGGPITWFFLNLQQNLSVFSRKFWKEDSHHCIVASLHHYIHFIFCVLATHHPLILSLFVFLNLYKMVTTHKSRNKPECFGISIEENKKLVLCKNDLNFTSKKWLCWEQQRRSWSFRKGMKKFASLMA